MIISAATLIVWSHSALPFRINWTGSAPVGLYTIYHEARMVTTGDLVIICLQGAVAVLGRAKNYLTTGSCPNGTSPILKEVVATAGDEVELMSEGIAVNGRVVDRSQRRIVDSLGRPLELFPLGRRIVRNDEIWVLGVHRERSWDSRYFGPISSSSIVGVARPLLTMNVGRAQ